MPILSLCTGFGGLDLAVEYLTGEKTAYVAEIDPYASKLLMHHHPEIPNLGDITQIDWTELLGQVDIVTAGFPCTDISNAGHRKGIDGEKSRVWYNVAAAIRVLRPRLVFLENVSAIARRGLDTVLGDLAEAGYDARWLCLRASEVGAAHHRDRWFCVAFPSNASGDRHRDGGQASLTGLPSAAEPGDLPGRAAEPSPRGGHLTLVASDPAGAGLEERGGQRARGDEPAAQRGGPSPSGGARALPDAPDADGLEPQRRGVDRELGSTPAAEPGEEEQRQRPGDAAGHRGQAPADTARERRTEGCAEPAGPRRELHAPAGRGGAPSADPDSVGRQGRRGPRPFLDWGDEPAHRRHSPAEWWGEYLPAIRRWEEVLGLAAPYPTEVGPRGGRRLASAFAEWLMGVPGRITEVPGLSRTQQLHKIGNGVVPQQAYEAYRRILLELVLDERLQLAA